ncbi:GGDEF domain-containing protein [Ferrimicrobium sp.]|uniref:GGDEF domain-containing protein n=1 Tax=Ferrimicrobium sp. TaxID=2926050 RepID=UPI002619A6AF|nr:GGDEF domain-containing protein [Ferrimicrobium sp.]
MGGDEKINSDIGTVTSSWDRMHRVYWRVALVLIPSMAPALYFGNWALRLATLSFGVSMAILFPLRRRIPRSAILIHAGIAYSTAIVQLVLPAAAVITVLPPNEWRPALAIFATVGIFALGIYGGWLAGIISLTAAIAILSSNLLSNVPILIALVLGVAAGIAIRAIIAELISSHEQLSRHALTDPLTGLHNRRAMEQEYAALQAHAVGRGVSMFLSLWDLDNLKQINDTKGHAEGDSTLLSFAVVLREALKEGDSIFRIGGDEFCCLHLGLKDGASVVERVRRAAPSVSVGLLECLDLALDEALRQVDKLMYEDKRRRRGEIGAESPATE